MILIVSSCKGIISSWISHLALYLKAFDENDSIVELIFTIHIHYPGHAERFREEHVNQETLEVKQPYLAQNLITRQRQIDFLQLT